MHNINIMATIKANSNKQDLEVYRELWAIEIKYKLGFIRVQFEQYVLSPNGERVHDGVRAFRIDGNDHSQLDIDSLLASLPLDHQDDDFIIINKAEQPQPEEQPTESVFTRFLNFFNPFK